MEKLLTFTEGKKAGQTNQGLLTGGGTGSSLAINPNQVIKGLSNSEIQKDVLSKLEPDSLTLEKLLTFIEGKKAGQTSQGLLAGGGTGSGLAINPTKKCSFCGDSHKRGRRFCKAGDYKCSCGCVGHFPKMCRCKGRPQRRRKQLVKIPRRVRLLIKLTPRRPHSKSKLLGATLMVTGPARSTLNRSLNSLVVSILLKTSWG